MRTVAGGVNFDDNESDCVVPGDIIKVGRNTMHFCLIEGMPGK